MIDFNIRNYTGEFYFTAKIDCHESELEGYKKRLAVEWALANNAPLHDANLQQAELQDIDLRGANLTRANLEGSNLCDANLEGAILVNANLRDADLTYVKARKARLYQGQLAEV